MRSPCKLILTATLVAACHATAGANSLQGVVRDANTLAPLAGVSVALHIVNPDSIMLQTLSDGSGHYGFSNFPVGNEVYALMAGQSGYAGFYARIPDPGTGDVTFDILLEESDPPPPPPPGDPDSSAVSGRVLESGSQSGVPNATVMLHSDAGDFQVQTDAAGNFDLHVAVGAYGVRIEASGFLPLVDRIDAGSSGLTYQAMLQPGTADVPPARVPAVTLRGAVPNPFTSSGDLVFWLSREGRVSLRVYDLAGRMVASIAEGWMAAGDHSIPFSLTGLAGGTYFCRLQFEGETATAAITAVR